MKAVFLLIVASFILGEAELSRAANSGWMLTDVHCTEEKP
jgi:hypothetical protein